MEESPEPTPGLPGAGIWRSPGQAQRGTFSPNLAADLTPGCAVDDVCRASGEPRPRRSTSRNALGRHRAKVDLRPGLGMQEVGRRPPARAPRPALRQPMQLAERVGDTTPVGLRLGRSALHIAHHHQTFGEQPAVRSRDRHRHRQPCAVEVSQQLGLPREVSVAAGAETTDRAMPVDAHAPYLVDANSAGERFETSDVVAPLLESLLAPQARVDDAYAPARPIIITPARPKCTNSAQDRPIEAGASRQAPSRTGSNRAALDGIGPVPARESRGICVDSGSAARPG